MIIDHGRRRVEATIEGIGKVTFNADIVIQVTEEKNVVTSRHHLPGTRKEIKLEITGPVLQENFHLEDESCFSV